MANPSDQAAELAADEYEEQPIEGLVTRRHPSQPRVPGQPRQQPTVTLHSTGRVSAQEAAYGGPTVSSKATGRATLHVDGKDVSGLFSAISIEQDHQSDEVNRILGSDLAAWWRAQTDQAILATVPKAYEYGSRDLLEMGATLHRVKTGQDLDLATTTGREKAIETACWFYTVGKIARWTAAIERGEAVSGDTIFDIGVYTTMVQRSRDTGGRWPA